MKNLKKVYFITGNLDSLWKEELDNFMYLLDADYDEIFDNHYLYWLKDRSQNKNKFSYWTVLEVLLFNKYMKDIWINDLQILYEPQFFLFNEKLYKIDNKWNIKEIWLEWLWIFSIRAKMMLHPSFEILSNLIENYWWTVYRANFKDLKSTCFIKNKLHSIIFLYKKRSKFIWDIIIPNWIKEWNEKVFINWMRDNFSDKIVIKEDWIQCCSWLTILDLKNWDQKFNIEKIKYILKSQNSTQYRPYILPYYDFKNEYRIYFSKYDWNIKIHSVKWKKLKNSNTEFKNWKDMSFSWFKIEKWDNIQHIIKYTKEMLEIMDFETWTLEFGELDNWDIIFFEVNPSSNPMMFENDQEIIKNFYVDIFDDFVK